MNQALSNTTPAIGTPLGGGFVTGQYRIGERKFLLITASKAEGEHDDIEWSGSSKMVEGATSYFDGLANTNAMVEAGSDLAKWARGLRIAGFDDWYLPSQDEKEMQYRAFKPTVETNSQYGRSGINLSALPPTYPYTEELPAQTTVEAFQSGGSEAFDDVAYWTSTQHAAYSWCQHFYDGSQNTSDKIRKLRARAVRRLEIQ